MEKDLKSERRSSHRWFAFCGVVLSTISVSACLISFPLVFRFVQELRSAVENDLEFCRGKSRDMWRGVLDLEQTGKSNAERMSKAIHLLRQADPLVKIDFETLRFVRAAKRTVAGAAPGNSTNVTVSTTAAPIVRADEPVAREDGGACCTCHRSPPGPPGLPGNDGYPGMDGEDGKPGDNGGDAQLNYDPKALFQKDCPCEAPPGELGPAGPKGPPGTPGTNGPNGEDGKGGDNGLRGEPGKAGPNGKAGPKGPPGDDGLTEKKEGAPGPGGPAGKDGPPGPPGTLGEPGKAGADGKPGEQGPAGAPGNAGQKGADGKQGPKGEAGPKGSCAQCPPPRTAPGY